MKKFSSIAKRPVAVNCKLFMVYSFIVALLVPVCAGSVSAQIKVSPEAVNVSSQTPTAAFLTFGNLTNQIPAEATWCGDLIPAAPGIGRRCNPATIFGVIPARYNRTTASGTRAYTDVMTLPASVARRAYQSAAGGANSSFFFVRRFISTVGGPDEFVVVVCRMSGGSAGSPFSLTDVRLKFSGTEKPILFIGAGESLPQIEAEISYTGAGRLKGTWQIVMPGEEQPSAEDLLTEASLPIEKRGTQKHYTELSRFNVFLPANGKYTLTGPEPSRFPNNVAGEYLLLLRVQASENVDDSSDLDSVGAGPTVVYSGAVAGFPMPVLRYFVSSAAAGGPTILSQLLPAENETLPSDGPITFVWSKQPGAALYRLEIVDLGSKTVLEALLPAEVSTYLAPSWLAERVGNTGFRWRVVGFDASGKPTAESQFRNLRFQQ